MPNTAYETPEAYKVISLYQSCPEPEENENGYEVQVATLPNGTTHSLLLTDHAEGNLIEMPPEIAVAFAYVMNASLDFRGSDAFLTPPAILEPDEDSDDLYVISIFRSHPNPLMGEQGYEIFAAVDEDNLVHEISFMDSVASDQVDMPPEIARSVGRAMAAFPLFPTSTLN